MSGAAVVRLEGVARTFGEGEMAVRALSDVTLEVHGGEVVGAARPLGQRQVHPAQHHRLNPGAERRAAGAER